MKNYCRALFFGIIFAGVAGIGYTQIDQGELQKNLAPVSFINFEGPHARIETREQIRQIGVGLGQAVKAGGERAGAGSRYFVIHSVSAPDGNKLDADIFGLGANTGVDHIRNLRTIIQGYLQEAYDYSAQDAALLAEYITIYNAVYRGNWDYFSGRYKKPVVDNLNPQQAGLATRYTEWPGKTLMLIPLGLGGISSIDTSLISDSRVVEEMRREDDKGIEQRRNMVDLKEREAAAAEQKAATQRDAVKKEEKAIATEKSQLEKDRQQLADNKSQGAVTPAEAAKQEAEIQKKSDDLDKRESELALQRDDAAKQEQLADKKTDEAQRERESIAKDQQSIINRGETPQGLIGIILEQKDAVVGRLVTIDPATRKELRRSQLNTVYVRTLTFVGGKVLAIAGQNQGGGAIRLIEIDSSTLEMTKQGNDDIHPNSLIWVNGSDLYAVTADLTNGTLNLGRFNADLALQAKSTIAVHPNAMVSIQQSSLLTQRADGTAALLNAVNLTEQQ